MVLRNLGLTISPPRSLGQIDFARMGRYLLVHSRWFGSGGKGMCAASSTRINRLLAGWRRGNEEAQEALIPVVYDELRLVARRHLWRERPDHSLQSAALVNEAYLRLVRQEAPRWRNRAHFFAVAAELIELRFFGGLSIKETAAIVGNAPTTVKREWATARAWLQRELKKDSRK